MSRIPLVTGENLTPEQQRVFDAMRTGARRSAPVGPLAVAMHRPDLAEAWSALGLVLRFNSSFPPDPGRPRMKIASIAVSIVKAPPDPACRAAERGRGQLARAGAAPDAFLVEYVQRSAACGRCRR
jgi:hypothetical protein